MSGSGWRWPRPQSLRQQLLWGILLPVVWLVLLHSWSLYHEALEAVHTAYDRSLLASAKTIGEQLDIEGQGEQARLGVRVSYAALEAFETDNQSRMYYRVSDAAGRVVSGYADLPDWQGRIPMRPAYAALVDFYDDHYRGQTVRVAAVWQPVASPHGRGMALIQVAETTELREALARDILLNTLWRQGLLLLVITGVVFGVVRQVFQPVRALSASLETRAENDLTPLPCAAAPHELRPLLQATNGLMERLSQLIEHQKRFVRDTSHQLRTPLAVLKVQLQSALRGDQAPEAALREMLHTVDRATRMANQMLALAKVEQLRDQATAQRNRLDRLVRDVALDLAPLLAERELDFDLQLQPLEVNAHEWMLNELARNLLHNAIKHTPVGQRLQVSVQALSHAGPHACLSVCNDGPSLPEHLKPGLFDPFVAAGGQQGAGLGLAICHGITEALGGHIEAGDWREGDTLCGVCVRVTLPLRPNPPGAESPLSR